MTKYNHYAKELDEAFKEAREIYIKAYTEYSGTKKAFEELPYMSGMIPFDVAERRKKAKYDYEIAELKFNEAKRTVWQNFNNRRAELRRQLEAEVAKNGIANPESVDMATVELLKSGVLTVDDYIALVEKYDDNPTMLKLVAKYVKEAANDDKKTASERGRLSAINAIVKDGKAKVIRKWDDLSTVADYCSNQRNPTTVNSDRHTMSMVGHWEECSANTINEF